MNATLDINYDLINKSNIFSEIEEICNDSYSKMYALIRLFFLKRKSRKVANKYIRLHDEVIRNIYHYDFNSVKKLEDIMREAYNSFNTQSYNCKNCIHYHICGDIIRDTFTIPLKISFEKTLKSIENCYHLNAKELSIPDKELKEYKKSLEVFRDIWDDETPVEDKKFIFEHNAKN